MLRISGSQQNAVRKDLLRLATTVNVGILSGRSREVVEMFERRRVDVKYRDQGTRVNMEVRKVQVLVEHIKRRQKQSRDHGERKPTVIEEVKLKIG